MELHLRVSQITDEDTRPLSFIGSLTLQTYLECHALTIRDVAHAAHVRLLVVWNVLHDNPILLEDAGKVRAGLFLLTGVHYHGFIPVRATPAGKRLEFTRQDQPVSNDEHQGLTRELASL